MDLDALRHLNFSQLDDAIDDWDQMARGLKTVADNAEKNLKGKADRANWTGYNAAVTREFVDKTSGEFSDAHTQADTVTKILKDTRGELGTYKTQLNTLIDSTTNMTVVDTGNGSFNVIPNPTTDPAGAKTNAASLRDQIEGILKKASESDTTAAKPCASSSTMPSTASRTPVTTTGTLQPQRSRQPRRPLRRCARTHMT
ncbi:MULTISPECIES: hypothetical protein [Streptomyces]|uniref:hypothetical protein n=1 Tax=Streptomyces TaxID=1883 RepID=UPI002E25A335